LLRSIRAAWDGVFERIVVLPEIDAFDAETIVQPAGESPETGRQPRAREHTGNGADAAGRIRAADKECAT
jgi:hypothetical protein